MTTQTDNDLPITQEWLDSIGMTYDDEWDRRYIEGLPRVSVLNCEEDGTDWAVGDWAFEAAIQPKTRGDVRAWLRALKVREREVQS